MELTIRTRPFEMCIRTTKMYVPLADNVFPPAVNVRLGRWVWTTAEGLRKLEAA